MKLFSIIRKSLKEQYRSFWLFVLTVSCAPFFVFVYYLIVESYNQSYRIEIVNRDNPVKLDSSDYSYGEQFIRNMLQSDTLKTFEIKKISSFEKGEESIRSKKSDVLIAIPGDFSEKILKVKSGNQAEQIPVEFYGDISGMKYMIGVVWAYSMISGFVSEQTGLKEPLQFKEIPVGIASTRSDFEMAVPGLLIFSIIMLMLSASSAMVYESENKTLERLKITKVTTAELMGGISAVQLVVGIISVLLTLITALLMGFRFEGSMFLVLLIASLASLSIIAFCLIIAAFCKTVTQVLIVGNFPLFIFMFFSGVMFPIQTKPWFSVAGYDISLISLLSPSHAVAALNKVLFMQQDFKSIMPELISLIVLTAIYGIVGGLLYFRRHLRSG